MLGRERKFDGERWNGNKNVEWEGRERKVLLRILMGRKRKNGESHAAMEGRVIMEKGKDGGEGVKTYKGK